MEWHGITATSPRWGKCRMGYLYKLIASYGVEDSNSDHYTFPSTILPSWVKFNPAKPPAKSKDRVVGFESDNVEHLITLSLYYDKHKVLVGVMSRSWHTDPFAAYFPVASARINQSHPSTTDHLVSFNSAGYPWPYHTAEGCSRHNEEAAALRHNGLSCRFQNVTYTAPNATSLCIKSKQ